jgi:hypothetical protein
MTLAVASSTSTQRPTRGDGLLSASALIWLALWLLNDHLLKQHTPGWLTGKLSDAGSMVVLPLSLQAAWELASKRERFVPSRAVIATACVLVGAFFVWMEATPLGSHTFRSILAYAQWPLVALHAQAWTSPVLVAHLADLEDLCVLPFLLIPYRIGLQRWRTADRCQRATS